MAGQRRCLYMSCCTFLKTVFEQRGKTQFIQKKSSIRFFSPSYDIFLFFSVCFFVVNNSRFFRKKLQLLIRLTERLVGNAANEPPKEKKRELLWLVMDGLVVTGIKYLKRSVFERKIKENFQEKKN